MHLIDQQEYAAPILQKIQDECLGSGRFKIFCCRAEDFELRSFLRGEWKIAQFQQCGRPASRESGAVSRSIVYVAR